jgi:hypothetical protein
MVEGTVPKNLRALGMVLSSPVSSDGAFEAARIMRMLHHTRRGGGVPDHMNIATSRNCENRATSARYVNHSDTFRTSLLTFAGSRRLSMSCTAGRSISRCSVGTAVDANFANSGPQPFLDDAGTDTERRLLKHRRVTG